MVIRIIEEKPDPSVLKQVICRSCGVKLEYVPNDIESKYVSDGEGGQEPVYFIKCPKCSKEISVKRVY